jgi:hypothetical protein
LAAALKDALDRDYDVILCFNSRRLFGEGDREHVALIEAFNSATGRVTMVDPAIRAPRHRTASIDKIFETIQAHDAGTLGGLWLISQGK